MPASRSGRMPPCQAQRRGVRLGRAAAVDHVAQVVVHDHQLEQPDAALVARVVAALAAARRDRTSCRRRRRASGPSSASISVGGMVSSRHLRADSAHQPLGQDASTVAVIKNVGTPMSCNRVIVLGASFVCSVLNTMCPVSDACTAISAVSRSRISPTRILSGSCRKMLRRHWANVLPISASIGIWMMPSMSYSTGSSVVISLSSISFSSFRRRIERRRLARARRARHQHDAVGLADHRRGTRPSVGRVHAHRRPDRAMTTERSSTRMTTLSPNIVGSTLTRMSTGWPPTVSSMRPSCGSRRSAMSRFGHHLDARGDGEGQVPRRRHHFVQHAVGLDADLELVLERLECMSLAWSLIASSSTMFKQLADRGAVGQRLDAGQVERPVLLHRLRPPWPGSRRPPCRRSTTRRSRRRRRSSARAP